MDPSENMTNNGTNQTLPFYSEFVEPRQYVGAWELVLCIVGSPMNALIVYMARNIVVAKTDDQENQHLCILSMAVADFLLTSLHSPLMFINFALSIDLNSHLCKFLYFVTHLGTVASSLSLLWLNIDKFVSLRCPLRYPVLLTYRRTKISILISWLISAAWACFFVFGPMTAFKQQCEVYIIKPYPYTAFFILFFVLPIVCSLGISLYILKVAVEARRTDHRLVSNSHPSRGALMPNNFSDSSNLTRNGNSYLKVNFGEPSPSGSIATNASVCDTPSAARRTVSRLKTVTFVFCTTAWASLTFIPYRIAYLFYHFYPDDPTLVRISFGLFALMVSNASGNPFITVATQHQYRYKVKKLFRKKKSLGDVANGAMRANRSSISLDSLDIGERNDKAM